MILHTTDVTPLPGYRLAPSFNNGESGIVDLSGEFESDIPTLVLSGRLDAQTPIFRSEEVKRTLRNAPLVVFPDGGTSRWVR